MGKGCVRVLLVSAVAFASLTSAWAFALKPSSGEPPWQRAAILGLLGVATLGSVANILESRSEIRLLEGSTRGIPPADGARGAAVGELQPSTGAVLSAPFSGEPALLYSYRVQRSGWVRWPSGRKSRTTVEAFAGDAMAPCVIRTAFGPVRMLEPPILSEASTTVEGPEAVARARAHLDSAVLEEIVSPDTEREVKKTLEARRREGLAAAGGYRTDCRITTPSALDVESPLDLAKWSLEETRFAPGETVTLFGRYDASRAGFDAVPTDVASGVFLSRGGVAENLSRKRSAIRLFTGLALLLLLAQAIVGGLGLLATRSAARSAPDAAGVFTPRAA